MARYKTYESENKVVVVSKFAGKAVRGVAKCAPDDTFDQKFGEDLAKARCDEKVAEKRAARASQLLGEAIDALKAAEERAEKMRNYVLDAGAELQEARLLVANLEAQAGMSK